MANKKLNEEFGISDKELDSLMNEADSERDSLSNLSKEDLEAIQARKDKVNAVKKSLKECRGMKNKDWATSIIQASVENAVITQHLALADIEDDFQSKKVTSISELTNAITSGASELVKLDQQDEHLAISREKNEIRKNEGRGGPILDSVGGEPIVSIGKSRELLKMIKNGYMDDEEETIGEDNINTVDIKETDG
jgi:hypothetical protein